MIEKVSGFLHWQKRNKPEYDLSSQIYGELKPFRLPLVLIILIILIGTLGYVALDNVPVFTAFYQTGITFTTVGFGEMYEMSPNGRIFSVFLIISGYAVFTVSIGTLISIINKGTLISLLKENRMIHKITRLKKHYVICYHNSYTKELTKELRKAHIPFVVVAPNDDLEEIARENKYPFHIKGEPHTDISMKKAHLSNAKGVVTLSKHIADNIAIISSVRLFEKELGRKPYFLMGVAENDIDIEKLKKLGANEIISPMKLMAKRITAVATNPSVKNILEEFVYQRNTKVDLEELKVPRSSWIVFKKLRESHLRDITNVSVVGIKDKKTGKFTPMPKGDVIVKAEDTLLIIGTAQGLKSTRKLIRASKKPEELKYV